MSISINKFQCPIDDIEKIDKTAIKITYAGRRIKILGHEFKYNDLLKSVLKDTKMDPNRKAQLLAKLINLQSEDNGEKLNILKKSMIKIKHLWGRSRQKKLIKEAKKFIADNKKSAKKPRISKQQKVKAPQEKNDLPQVKAPQDILGNLSDLPKDVIQLIIQNKALGPGLIPLIYSAFSKETAFQIVLKCYKEGRISKADVVQGFCKSYSDQEYIEKIPKFMSANNIFPKELIDILSEGFPRLIPHNLIAKFIETKAINLHKLSDEQYAQIEDNLVYFLTEENKPILYDVSWAHCKRLIKFAPSLDLTTLNITIDIKGAVSLTSLKMNQSQFASAYRYLPNPGLLKELHIVKNDLEGFRDEDFDLSRFSNLEILTLNDQNTINYLKSIEALTRLKKLDLKGCMNVGDSIGELGALRKLESLDLSGIQVEDYLFVLENFENLTKLSLKGNAKLSQLRDVSRCKNLKELDLSETAVKDEAIEQLKALTHLTHLTLDGCKQLKGYYFGELKHLPLTHLSLQGCSHFDMLYYLKQFKGLQSLNLEGCGFDERLLKGFQEEMKIPHFVF